MSQVPDVQPTAMDAPEVGISGDVVPAIDTLDVVDAGQQFADAVDVVRGDHVDAGTLTDRESASDVQCPTPLCNGTCVDTSVDPANCGRCGVSCPARCVAGSCVRFVGVVPVVPRDRYQFSVDPRAEWETMCRSGFAGSRVCRMVDVRGTSLHAEICAVVWPMRPNDGANRGLAALAEMPRAAMNDGGATSYFCAECTTGAAPVDGWGGCTVPHTIACCSP